MKMYFPLTMIKKGYEGNVPVPEHLTKCSSTRTSTHHIYLSITIFNVFIIAKI